MLTNNLLFGMSYQRSIYSTCFSVNHCSSFTQFGKQHFYFFCHSTADAPLCNFGANEIYSNDSWLFRFLWFKEQISFFPTFICLLDFAGKFFAVYQFATKLLPNALGSTVFGLPWFWVFYARNIDWSNR